jgi:hypothetical protein
VTALCPDARAALRRSAGGEERDLGLKQGEHSGVGRSRIFCRYRVGYRDERLGGDSPIPGEACLTQLREHCPDDTLQVTSA